MSSKAVPSSHREWVNQNGCYLVLPLARTDGNGLSWLALQHIAAAAVEATVCVQVLVPQCLCQSTHTLVTASTNTEDARNSDGVPAPTSTSTPIPLPTPTPTPTPHTPLLTPRAPPSLPSHTNRTHTPHATFPPPPSHTRIHPPTLPPQHPHTHAPEPLPAHPHPCTRASSRTHKPRWRAPCATQRARPVPALSGGCLECPAP